MKLAILGGGSWGTALAILWARHDHQVQLWARKPEDVVAFNAAGANTKYLPEVPFPETLAVVGDLQQLVQTNDLLCLSIPLQAYRAFLMQIKPWLNPRHRMILTSKGIELGTGMLPQEIVEDVLGDEWSQRAYTLSGPSFAKEVADDKPTTVVLAGPHTDELVTLQEALTTPTFRLYRNHDVMGVEICGALKNVIAIASGMVRGLDLGNNTMAGLITRGLHEISRYGVRLGAERETFAGLAGMGDLILTCTGGLSRNLRVGMGLASGKPLEQVLHDLGMVAEGVHTCKSVRHKAHELGVELPITEVVYHILYEGMKPQEGLRRLMTRSLKAEVRKQ
ncbi:NAD(P)H-dependent glycerol-3-phosphate dehydrogenase [Acanthopleuribacter pedis]|uniref:Glycerol-3-phosphate dehydrogenase [NAD(P)+] n=1 Tax=Acanthopleuribacter pedis TaxID=442870 RepID=A0A8J7QB35_9BACT|nr:NAD(P)-dependent glycerol-3-phosphate dehydrogenase [Acanthopleuribacter pedis]